ncbi:hypothetical protein HMI55_005820 [Coelomomyces lativittatus]|nr:hypothetical protein HMI55_005820 [Coelomomyces lativittatus]
MDYFLNHRIKVDHRVHNLGKSVKVQRSGHQAVTIYTTIPFSKRYYKYLTKKFLKKVNLRDWLRVVATDKQSFELKYFNVDEKEKIEWECEPPSTMKILETKGGGWSQ